MNENDPGFSSLIILNISFCSLYFLLQVPQGILQVGEVTVLKNFNAKSGEYLDILVENQGRVNFGKGMLGQIKVRDHLRIY
jgi:hypothetical protein